MAGLTDPIANGVARVAGGLLNALTVPSRVLGRLSAATDAVLTISTLAGAIGDLHTELAGLRADLSSMPRDSRRLADDVEVVHEVLRLLNTELLEITGSVAPVHDDLGRVEAGLATLPNQLGALLPKVDELAERLDGMREELADQLDGLRTDLTALPFVSKS